MVLPANSTAVRSPGSVLRINWAAVSRAVSKGVGRPSTVRPMLRLTSSTRMRSIAAAFAAGDRRAAGPAPTPAASEMPARSRNRSTWCHWMRRDSRCCVRCSQRRLLNGVCRMLRGLNRCTTIGMASSKASPNRPQRGQERHRLSPCSRAVEVGRQGLVVRLPRVDQSGSRCPRRSAPCDRSRTAPRICSR